MNDDALKKYKTYYACAITQGLLEREEVPEFAKKLAELVVKDDYHIDCGVLGIKFIFTAREVSSSTSGSSIGLAPTQKSASFLFFQSGILLLNHSLLTIFPAMAQPP